jgi:hypothetical protein
LCLRHDSSRVVSAGTPVKRVMPLA